MEYLPWVTAATLSELKKERDLFHLNIAFLKGKKYAIQKCVYIFYYYYLPIRHF